MIFVEPKANEKHEKPLLPPYADENNFEQFYFHLDTDNDIGHYNHREIKIYYNVHEIDNKLSSLYK